MTQNDLKRWIKYLDAAHMVDWSEILAFDQVAWARRFCACLRVGVLNKDDVTDLDIWRALTALRKEGLMP